MRPPTNKDTLVACLQGQQLQVPDLWPPFATWPIGRNPHYEAVIPSVDSFLERIIQEPKKLAALKNADFGLFVSCWWPYTGLDRLCVMGSMIAWLFLWDDELDHPMGSLGDDLQAGQDYINQTLLFAGQCLGLQKDDKPFTPNNLLISGFKVIGDALREAYTIGDSSARRIILWVHGNLLIRTDQREFFMKELTFYCNMCAVERKVRVSLASRIPTVEEFWAYRKGSTASRVVYATADYAYESNTTHVLKTPNGELLLDKLNVITSITNDIFSLKKELDHDRIESLIPFTVATHGNPQQAMDEAVSLLFKTAEEFKSVAEAMVSETNMQGGDLESVQKVIGAAQRQCTGHLAWGYVSKRYNLPKDRDGTISLRL